MSYPPTSLQLWSVRDLTKTDFAATVAQVAAIGYAGVETAGFGNLTAIEGAAAIKAAGLHVSGMHVGIGALRHEFDRVVAEAQACATRHIICPSWPKNQFATAASCTAVGQELGAIGARLRAFGLEFHFHNHAAELAVVEGRRVFDWLLDAAAPRDLGCQADVYWVHQGDKDPAEFIREQGRRIRLIHLKDEKELGLGPVDFPAVFTAMDSIGSVEWQVVEVEQYNHAPLDSVRLSFAQLKTWGRA